MPIKKTTTAKKPAAKKATVAKKPTIKQAVSKPAVVVETKKTNNPMGCYHAACKCKKLIPLVGFILILLTFVFSLLNFFKKDGAWKLEEIKVGGSQNLEKVMEFYQSTMYKDQQTIAIDQALDQVNMMNNMTEEEMYNLMNAQMDEDMDFDLEDISFDDEDLE